MLKCMGMEHYQRIARRQLEGGSDPNVEGYNVMGVVNVEQAWITEEAGVVAVMALERVPADIRAKGGVARMNDPGLIKEIKNLGTKGY